MNFWKKLFATRPRVSSCCGVDDHATPRHAPQAHGVADTRDAADGVCQTHGCTPSVAERPEVHAGMHDAKHGCCE